MRNAYYGSRRRIGNGYWGSIVRLMAHILGTAILFTAVLCAAWGLSYLVHEMNAAHAFPPAIYTFVTSLELWLVYIDATLSLVVLLFGAGRFIRELWEN